MGTSHTALGSCCWHCYGCSLQLCCCNSLLLPVSPMVSQIRVISPSRKPSCLQVIHAGCSPGAEAGMESAGSQQPNCCSLCDAQHPKVWEKPAGVTPSSLGKSAAAKEQVAALPCPALAQLPASTRPRGTHVTRTGSWEGASSATLASPGSSVRSLSGDIPCLQRFLISNLIYLAPGSLRLNITLATTRELILLPGSRTV